MERCLAFIYRALSRFFRAFASSPSISGIGPDRGFEFTSLQREMVRTCDQERAVPDFLAGAITSFISELQSFTCRFSLAQFTLSNSAGVSPDLPHTGGRRRQPGIRARLGLVTAKPSIDKQAQLIESGRVQPAIGGV